MEKNLIFRTFGIWHSKTKVGSALLYASAFGSSDNTQSLPAIRFHADNTKAKFFEIWQRGMPRALQAKKAREMDRKATLCKFLVSLPSVGPYYTGNSQTSRQMGAKSSNQDGSQSCGVSDNATNLKESHLTFRFSRARYLRLPTSTPRQTASTTRTVLATTPLNNRKFFPRRRVEDVEADEDTGQSPSLRPFGTRPTLTDYPRTKPPSEVSLPRSKHSTPNTRDPSPARSRSSFQGYRLPRETSPTRSALGPSSSAGGEAGRSLWSELRELQRKSRPSSQHSKS
jgi:protein SFI1